MEADSRVPLSYMQSRLSVLSNVYRSRGFACICPRVRAAHAGASAVGPRGGGVCVGCCDALFGAKGEGAAAESQGPPRAAAQAGVRKDDLWPRRRRRLRRFVEGAGPFATRSDHCCRGYPRGTCGRGCCGRSQVVWSR
eukprot:6188082-Pleurochrysis_carterae.AAC.3